jgi:hypothetical protein
MNYLALINMNMNLLPNTSNLHPAAAPAPQMDLLLLANFLFALVAIVAFKEQRHNRLYAMVFAIATAVIAALALAHGAFAAGCLVAFWSILSFRRWWKRTDILETPRPPVRRAVRTIMEWRYENRMARLFGTPPSEYLGRS